MVAKKQSVESNALRRTGAQGWSQFLTKKKEMLDAYRSGKRYSRNRKVRASHGKVAEAEFRKWLAEFLPKRFSVTSGYVISYSLSEDAPLLHCDVIIYDQLAAPVLWVEPNPDESSRGNVRAIPAEHVYAILEVKSRLTPRSAIQAIRKIEELRPLLHADPEGYPYPRFLPLNFSAHVVFFELLASDAAKISTIDNLLPQDYLRGYAGGLVLSGEGVLEDSAGQLALCVGKEPIGPLVPDRTDLVHMSNSKEYMSGAYFCLDLAWSENAFARFGFDLVARLTGTYRAGFASSFHAMSILTSNPTDWPFGKRR
jgi:hypothetical protein